MPKQNYVAEYIALNRAGQWNQPAQGCPKYSFKAEDDNEALDIALTFAKKPMMYAAGIKKNVPIPQAKYELIKLYQTREVALTRKSSRKSLEVCVGKNDFNFFV